MTTFTLETWFKRTGAGVGVTTGTRRHRQRHPAVTKGGAEARDAGQRQHELLPRHRRHERHARRRLRGQPTGPNHPVSGTAVVTSNVWHHAAATYDATTGTWKLYLDGALDRTLALGSAFQPQSASIQHAALGTSLTSTGPSPTAGGFFAGVLDEARIWNVARSDAQIAANFNKTLTAGAGLIARYGLNEGAGTTTASSVAGAPAGTLDQRPAVDRRPAAHAGWQQRARLQHRTSPTAPTPRATRRPASMPTPPIPTATR